VAEMHLSSMKDGVMSMRSLNSVEIGSGAPLSFEPNGRHVMLMGLKRPLKAGEEFPLVLTFANAGPVEVRVRVLRPGEAVRNEGMDNTRR
jgi:periplasmic copper chaperone A